MVQRCPCPCQCQCPCPYPCLPSSGNKMVVHVVAARDSFAFCPPRASRRIYTICVFARCVFLSCLASEFRLPRQRATRGNERNERNDNLQLAERTIIAQLASRLSTFSRRVDRLDLIILFYSLCYFYSVYAARIWNSAQNPKREGHCACPRDTPFCFYTILRHVTRKLRVLNFQPSMCMNQTEFGVFVYGTVGVLTGIPSL